MLLSPALFCFVLYTVCCCCVINSQLLHQTLQCINCTYNQQSIFVTSTTSMLRICVQYVLAMLSWFNRIASTYNPKLTTYGTFNEILTLVDLYIYSVLFKLLYLLQGLHYQHSIFTTLYHIISLCISVLHKHGADVTKSDTSYSSKPPHLQVGVFKLLQFLLVRRGPVTIDWFCSLIFILSVMEIPLYEVNAHFPARFVPYTLNSMRFAKMIGAKRPGKCALTSHSGISVTDKIKINKQNKSIATEPLYVHSEFEAIWRFLPEDVVVLNHMRHQTL